MIVTRKAVGLGKAVVGSVGVVRGDENRSVNSRYSDAMVNTLHHELAYTFSSPILCLERQGVRDSLLPGESCPESGHDVDTPNTKYGRQQPLAPEFLLFDDPLHGNETGM